MAYADTDVRQVIFRQVKEHCLLSILPTSLLSLIPSITTSYLNTKTPSDHTENSLPGELDNSSSFIVQ